MVEKMVLLDIEKVDVPQDAFRDMIDPDQVRELAESIRNQGLLQPILVRPQNGRYEVIAGHRRLLAHRLLGEAKIKSLVKEIDDEQAFVIRAMENDQREDLNPIEKGKVYKRLKDKFGWSDLTIAQKMGRGKASVQRYLELLEIPEEFQKYVAQKKLSMMVALILNRIEDPEFKSYYFTAAVENGVTHDVAEAWVKDWKKTKLNLGPDDGGGGSNLGQIQESLPIFQPCLCCLGPVEINKLKMIYVCPDCLKQIKGALKPN